MMIMVETAGQQTTELLIVKAGDDYIRYSLRYKILTFVWEREQELLSP